MRSGTVRLTVAAVIVALVVAAGLVACSSGGGGPAATPTIEVAPDRFVLGPDRIRGVPAVKSDEQARMLTDGVLSFPEYERALFAFRTCLSDQGVDMTELALTPRNNYTYSLRYREDDAARAQQTISTCYTEHFDVVDQLWAEHTAPSQVDLQQARDAMAKCLRGYGFDLPEHPASEDFNPLRKTLPVGLVECSWKVSAEFGLPGFAG